MLISSEHGELGTIRVRLVDGELNDLGCVQESHLLVIQPGEMLYGRGWVPRQPT